MKRLAYQPGIEVAADHASFRCAEAVDGPRSAGQKQYAEIIDNGVTLARDVAEFVKTSRILNW
jgi:hypothetical protein